MNIKKINLKSIRIDGGTQSRVSINEDAVASYAEAMTEGATLPPVVVFRDGADDWLADGFHRFHAHNRIGAVSIEADIHAGTQRDAVLYSVGANGKHGMPPSNADKRQAVMTLLNDAEWSVWSDRDIAKQCHVSHRTVGAHRASLGNLPSEESTHRTYTTKHGTDATMNTSGQKDAAAKKKAATKPAPDAEPAAEQIEEYKRVAAEAKAVMDEALADNNKMGELLEADDRTAALFEENKQLRAQVKQLRLSLAGQTNKNNELIVMVKSLQARLKKMEATA